MARYSLFVLKVPLTPKQANKQTSTKSLTLCHSSKMDLPFKYKTKTIRRMGRYWDAGIEICISQAHKQEAQLILTNPRDVFRGHWRSPNMVQLDMLGMVSYWCVTVTSVHYWMRDAHHCSGPPSPKWPILCRVGR